MEHSLKITGAKSKIYLLLLTVFLFNTIVAQENTAVEISGQVIDQQKNVPVPGVSIQIKGAVTGTISANDGRFTLRTRQSLPFTLVFSSVGFQQQEMEVKTLGLNLRIELVTQTVLGNEVVVTASRVPENILRSPVAVEKLDVRAIRETPAAGFYDALENVKGVQMITSGLTFKVPNTRGFNIPNNFRFMQLTDGVDMQAATLGVPLGNAIGPTELDIQSVEITPGAASALYGMNAINGMANLLTKSPFAYQGLSVYQKTGVNHVDGIDRQPSLLTETAFRYAKAFHNKFAFKINGSYMRGTDWVASSTSDQNPNNLNTANPAFPELNGVNNAAYDGWNKYGDENNNAVTIRSIQYNGSATTFLVRRTGYWEKDLVKPEVDNLKFDLSLHYRFKEKSELSYTYRVGKMDGIFQRGNKIQLDNVVVQSHKLELKGEHYFVRSYLNIENTGDSYNLKPTADNLDLTYLSNNAWGGLFKQTLQTSLDNGADLNTAMQAARQAADAGRVEPGTAAFANLLNTIRKINNWDHANAGIPGAPATGGSRLLQKSRLYHLEGQWNLANKIKIADLLAGADIRVYEVIPDGNNFVDFSRPVNERTTALKDGSFGKNVYYKKIGAFAQVTKTLLEERLKLFASARLDYNPEFKPVFNPRFAIVYTAAQKHNFRFAVQNGFRFPALFEALSFVNNGNVRRVGGLAYINEGLGYLENSYTLASVNTFNAAVNKDITNGATSTEAALQNRQLLQKTSLEPTRLEQILSFEIGYKSVLLNNRLVIDWDAFANRYAGFLGQVEVSVPSSGLTGSDAAVIDMLAENRSKQTRYRVFTNAKNIYHNYGSSLGITWLVYKKYKLSGNLNYNDIASGNSNDVFVTAFNTPRWAANIIFGNREVVKNAGFNIVWRWQDAFLWQSPLANGVVPAYSTLDAQVSFQVPALKSAIKLGGVNLLNRRYIQYAAGPAIGGLYYVAVTVDGLLIN